MAAVVSDTDWIEALDLVVGALDDLPLGQVQARCSLARSKFEAVEVRRLAAEVGADGDDSRARKLAGAGGGRSKRSARAAARRAAAVAKNNRLADDLESGELSDEKLDTIADAAVGDESAATDPEFIDAIKKRSVDQGRKLAAKRKTQAKDGETEHAKQRRLRNARRWKDTLTGLSILQLAGDDATIEELWNLVTAGEKRLKEADGGRDLAASKHPRSLDQRLFDAAVELMRSGGAGGAGGAAGSAMASGGSKPSIVVQIGVDGQASIAGGGPIPDQAAIEILARAGVSVQLIDSLTSQPLWQGRSVRHATSAQWIALIVRDSGCVLCGAHWNRCEAHHMTPWNAPAKGETNIDEMALMCVSCHHELHADRLTLERLDDGTYKTRPATPDEVAPQARGQTMASRGDQRSGNRRSNGSSHRPMATRAASSPCVSTVARDDTTGGLHRRRGSDNPSLQQRPGRQRRSVDGSDDDRAPF